MERVSSLSITFFLSFSLLLFLCTRDIFYVNAELNVLKIDETLIRNKDKITTYLNDLETKHRLKIIAYLNSSHVLTDHKNERHLSHKANKDVSFHKVMKHHQHFLDEKYILKCKLFIDTDPNFLDYLLSLIGQRSIIDLTDVDDNIVTLKFKNFQSKEWALNKIRNMKEVLVVECGRPEISHNHHGLNIIFNGGDNSALLHYPNEIASKDVFTYGKNIIASIIDTGIDINHVSFYDENHPILTSSINRKVVNQIYEEFYHKSKDHNKVLGYFAFLFHDPARNTDFSDGQGGHGTHTASTLIQNDINQIRSICNKQYKVSKYSNQAKLLVFDAQNDTSNSSTGGLHMPNSLGWVFKLSKDSGSNIMSCSWGSETNNYTLLSYEIDKFLYENERYKIIVSAGNTGPENGTIGNPANAKNVITVGASLNSFESFQTYFNEKENPNYKFKMDDIIDGHDIYNENNMPSFSSRGPAVGNRIKPDIVAPGAFVLSGYSNFQEKFPHCSRFLLQGTSMATPLISNAVIMIDDVFSKTHKGEVPYNFLVKAILVTFAFPLHGSSLNYKKRNSELYLEIDEKRRKLDQNDYGFGLVDLSEFIMGNYGYEIIDMTTLGPIYVRELKFLSNVINFHVTMAYNDIPTLIFTGLVNNFNLRVLHFDKDYNILAIHDGNGFSDDRNNVERVRLDVHMNDIIRIEIASKGLIKGWDQASDGKIALVWNKNPSIVSNVFECHEQGLRRQCVEFNSSSICDCVCQIQHPKFFGKFINECEIQKVKVSNSKFHSRVLNEIPANYERVNHTDFVLMVLINSLLFFLLLLQIVYIYRSLS